MSNSRQALQHTVENFWKTSQVYRVERWNAEKVRVKKIWSYLPIIHKGVVSVMVCGAGAMVILLPFGMRIMVDGLIGARGIGVALGALQKSVAALLIVGGAVGISSAYIAPFDGEARTLLLRVVWRVAIIASVGWMVVSGWYVYAAIIVSTLFFQSSFQQRALLVAMCVVQGLLVVLITQQAIGDAAARVLTVGEAVGVVCWAMMTLMLLTKNKHVINNLVMKK